MTVHKLHLEEYNDIDYQVIAIHTSLEDYRLAYYINQNLPIILRKSESSIQISSKEGESQFSRFIFENEEASVYWNLIQNKNNIVVSSQTVNQGLFAASTNKFLTKIYFLPEFKKVDYFLKIENAEAMLDISEIINRIKKINRISTVYAVDLENIKSKNNLIF